MNGAQNAMHLSKSALPLAGFDVRTCPGCATVSEAAGILIELGATSALSEGSVDLAPGALELLRSPNKGSILPGGTLPHGHARLESAVTDVPGLPRGVAARACAITMAMGALVSVLSGRSIRVQPDDVAAQLLLPLMVGVTPKRNREPRRRNGGWLATELHNPGDEETFATLLATLGADAQVGEIAAEAQLWRLPVAPYLVPSKTKHIMPSVAGLAGRRRTSTTINPATSDLPLRGITVLDATVMWAGPLGTWILAELGAHVIKIEPACRLDGTRGLPVDPTLPLPNPASLYAALNRGKARWDLDLREPANKLLLARAALDADLMVDNLSPRARRDLGIGRSSLGRVAEGLPMITIPAFAKEDERRSWVGYGSMVHAMSGLGWRDGRAPLAAAVAYPDVLTGLTTANVCLALLLGRLFGWSPVDDIEVPLGSSVDGLPPHDPVDRADPLLSDPASYVRRLKTSTESPRLPFTFDRPLVGATRI